MRARRTVSAACAAVLLLLASSAAARADVFGSATLLSGDLLEQAEYAHDPAASEDGRYVVFDGSVGGVPGVWRRETRPGARLEQVAGGAATMPSISADGRYVSFTTNEGASLPAITDEQVRSGSPFLEAPSVYVRDMGKPAAEAGAFTLVSAKNHSTQSLTYEFPEASEAEAESKKTQLGASAAGPSAITADGRTVVFVTTAQSDLAGPGTPPRQVAVRHLDSAETQLVSVRYDPVTGRPALDAEGGTEPVAPNGSGFGAVFKSPGSEAFEARGYEIPRGNAGATLPGASISADGSAVAWLGQDIGEQARILSEEGAQLSVNYSEPLWRRIAGGSSEPTRRVTGGSDPEDPACEARPEGRLPPEPSSTDPCQGPFATQSSGGFGIWNGREPQAEVMPRLSANGEYVAFISSAVLSADAAGFPFGGESNSDAYRADMAAPSRKAALTQVTQFASAEIQRVSTNADVTGIAISPDGQQVAFTTKRTVFPLAAPAYVSVPAAVPGLGELYDADLGDETLTRVVSGYEGGAPQHAELESTNEDPYSRTLDGALWPSFSANGNAIVFSSTASNLVYGDGNNPPPAGSREFTDGADVFSVPRITFTEEPTPQTISPAPANPSPQPAWQLTVTAASLRSGAVLLRASVPATGALAASASSKLSSRVHKRLETSTRTVARALYSARSAAPATIELHLYLSARYRALATRRGGLRATITVTFASNGHPTLRRVLAIRFARGSSSPRRKRK